jgi:hypothetical protein
MLDGSDVLYLPTHIVQIDPGKKNISQIVVIYLRINGSYELYTTYNCRPIEKFKDS